MRVLFLEPFYGGSHRDVADNVRRRSGHQIDLQTLPARFWKWRMRGAALALSRRIPPRPTARYDLIACTGMMSIADLKALAPAPLPPILLYAHETQLGYPAASGSESDLHFAFTDLTNMLVADRIAFNSRTHRDAFITGLPRFLRRLPEHRPMWAVEAIAAKSSVCYPGIELADRVTQHVDPPPTGPQVRVPLIVWNHRWEFDKQPERFFAALRIARDAGVPFRVAILGESFQVKPRVFLEAQKELGERIVHFGFAASRADYLGWLSRADIVVSAAIQENFGIAVMEAIAHGAIPLLPRRLSYPEVVPEPFHRFLYEHDDELAARLVDLLRRVADGERAPTALVEHARGFAWEHRIAAFDELFAEVGRSV